MMGLRLRAAALGAASPHCECPQGVTMARAPLFLGCMQAWCCDPASRADRAEKLFGWAGVLSGCGRTEE